MVGVCPTPVFTCVLSFFSSRFSLVLACTWPKYLSRLLAFKLISIQFDFNLFFVFHCLNGKLILGYG